MGRYPLGALVAVSGLTEAALARKVGLSGTTLKAARHRGLTEEAADRYATRAGFHPVAVWPNHGHVKCELDACPAMFLPTRDGHRFHTQLCARKAWQRRPENKPKVRAAKRRWRESAGDYPKAYDRTYTAERKRRTKEAA